MVKLTNYLVSLDWFSCSLLDISELLRTSYDVYTPENGHPWLIKKWYNPKTGKTGTRQYADVYEVFYEDQIFGTITANPHSSIIREDLIVFKAENERLYTDHFFNIFSHFLSAYKFQFNTFSRVDIAFDSIQIEELAHWTHAHKKNGFSSCHKITSGAEYIDGDLDYYRFGSRKGKKHLVFYNKSGELRDKNHKPYVLEKWDLNKLDQSSDVWRGELRFTGDEFRVMRSLLQDEHQELDYNILRDPDNLVRLFELGCQKFYEFYNVNELAEKGNVSRCETFIPIDFSSCIGGDNLVKIKYVPVKDKLTRYKRFLKALLREYIENSDTDYIIKMFLLARKHDLISFMYDKLERWINVLCAESARNFTNKNFEQINTDISTVRSDFSYMCEAEYKFFDYETDAHINLLQVHNDSLENRHGYNSILEVKDIYSYRSDCPF